MISKEINCAEHEYMNIATAIIDLPEPLTAMMSLILYKCFRTNDKDIFQLTHAFSRLISLTFLYCCSTTSVD